MTETTQKPKPDPKTLLHLSEQFLRRRYFTDCRKYAHQINPNYPGATQILAVADVLLAGNHQTPTGTLHDWYDVMQLDRYTHDTNLIKQRFSQLYELLNPSNNEFPFASEAFNLLCNAYHVLSNDVKKKEFDCLLKKIVDDDDEDGLKEGMEGSRFWTVCPYCYYLYEYERVYLELCLRCSNEECGRAFTSIEIGCPPVEVLNVGKYVCDGFVMLGLKSGCWNPFEAVSLKKRNQECDQGLNEKESFDGDTDKFVTISDDDVEGDVKRDVGFDVANVKANGRRKKSAARNVKKVTGAGNRVRKEAIVDREEFDDCEFF